MTVFFPDDAAHIAEIERQVEALKRRTFPDIPPHPNLAEHDTLGLATQTELDNHAASAGHTHPNLAAHDSLGLATQAELDAHTHPSPGHPDLAAHDSLGLATQAELDAHSHATQTIHSVAVYRSSNLAIANATETTVSPYTASRYDTSSMWDGVGLLVAPQTGTYLIWGSVMWTTNATGQRVLHLRVNDTTNIIDDHMLSGTNLVGPGMSSARAWRLNSGDNVRMNVLQESGGSLDLLGSSAHSAEFGMTWLGP